LFKNKEMFQLPDDEPVTYPASRSIRSRGGRDPFATSSSSQQRTRGDPFTTTTFFENEGSGDPFSTPASSQQVAGTASTGEILDLKTTVYRYKVKGVNKIAFIYSKALFMNLLDEISLLALINLSLFGSGKSLPGISIKAKVQASKERKDIAFVTKNVVSEDKGELSRLFGLNDPSQEVLTQKRLIQVFKGLVLCLKFVYFISKIVVTGKTLDESRSATEDVPTRKFISSLYQEMKSDTVFVKDFRKMYDDFVLKEKILGFTEDTQATSFGLVEGAQATSLDFSKDNQDTVFFLEIPTKRDFVNLGDPSFTSGKPVQQYVKTLYRWKRFLEKLRYFLEPLVKVPENYAATISSADIKPTDTVLVFTTFTQEVLPQGLGEKPIAFPGSPVWRRTNPFPVSGVGIEPAREQEIFDRVALESKISRLMEELKNTRKQAEDAHINFEEAMATRDRYFTESTKYKAMYEDLLVKQSVPVARTQGSNEITRLQTLLADSKRSQEAASLLVIEKERQIAQLQESQQKLTLSVTEKDGKIATLTKENEKEKGEYMTLKTLYDRTVAPTIFNDLVFLKPEIFKSDNILRNTRRYIRHILRQLALFNPVKEFFDAMMKLNTNITTRFKNEFALQGDLCSGIGGVKYLSWAAGEILKYLTSYEVISKFPSNLFETSSEDWLFGGFSIVHPDSRFVSPDLTRMINNATKDDISYLIFLRRLLFAKTAIDAIVTLKYVEGRPLLDQVYEILRSQTNETATGGVFKSETDVDDVFFIPLLLEKQKTTYGSPSSSSQSGAQTSTSTRKTVTFDVNIPSPVTRQETPFLSPQTPKTGFSRQ
jgi:5-hydroxyisourate hydrolase-like protein (transthyretin family)